MKLTTILTETIQDQIETISTKHKIPPEQVITTCKQVHKKYWKWVLQQWYYGNIKLPEDSTRITEVLTQFDKNKPKLAKKDINQYKKPNDLEQSLGIHAQTQKTSLNLPGVEIVHEKGPYITAKVSDPESLAKLGMGTKWCTRADYPDCMADDYIHEYGHIYIVFRDFEPFVQYTPDYEQVMDVNDEPVSGDLSGIIPPPPNPLPEEAVNYAINILNDRWPEAEPLILKDPTMAAVYAYKVLGSRWPEAEPIILGGGTGGFRGPGALMYYILNVVRGRWPEAEPFILRNPEWIYNYALNIIGGRWPEAEPFILRSPEGPEWAYRYAKNVIKDRWPEAEPVIMKNRYWKNQYKRFETYGATLA
jgi:hypothetical protein